MANKYCNLHGYNKISEEYQEINTGFQGVQDDIEALESGLQDTNTRVDNILDGLDLDPNKDPEVIDARLGADNVARPSVGDLIREIHSDVLAPDFSTPQTTVRPVIPLSNAEYGKLKYTLKGRTLTNLVENGNFKEGTSGWTPISSTIATSNNTLTVTGSGLENYAMARQTTKCSLSTGKRIFVRMRAKVTNNSCRVIAIQVSGDGEGSNISAAAIEQPSENTIYTVYGIFVQTNQVGLLQIKPYHSYVDAATANGKVMEVQEVIALDLDQYPDLQGLTAEEINAQIPGYIDGMQSVENVKMVSVGKNLFDGRLENGNIVQATGLPAEQADRKRTDFIKIRPNTDYVLNRSVNVYFYDGNKTYSGYQLGISTFNSGSASFVRLAASTSSMEELQQLEQGTPPTPYEPYQESTMFLPVPLRQLPNGVTDTIDSEGNYVRQIGEYTLKSEDIEGLNTTSYTNVDVINIYLSPLSKMKDYGVFDNIATKIATDKTTPRNGGAVDTIEGQWKHSINPSLFQFIIPKGTYANLEAAQTALAGTKIIYELETPVTSKINIPPVTSFKDGTLMFQNRRKHILRADDISDMYTGSTNVDVVNVPLDVFPYSLTSYVNYDNNFAFSINGMNPTYSHNNISEIGKWWVTPGINKGVLRFVVPKGTTLAQAKEQLAGLEIEYETIPFPLPEVEYSFPANLAAGVQGNTEMIAQLGQELGDLWLSLISIADKELAMGLVSPLTTSTNADLQNKINEILTIWT